MKKTLLLFIVPLLLFSTSASAVHADIFTTGSGTATKILDHGENELDPAWLSLSFNDSSWSAPFSVWNGWWWRVCDEWLPTNPTDTPPCGANWNFMRKAGVGSPMVISARQEVDQSAYVRNFVRHKFTLPESIVIQKATLYFSSDNVVKYWVNAKPTKAGQTNSLVNDSGNCSNKFGAQGGNMEGGIHTLDTTSFIMPGDNILAGNLLNTRKCDNSHPFGLQFI